MSTLPDFVRNYDELIFHPSIQEMYGTSDFFNVGYWKPETGDQVSACQNLVDRLLEGVLFTGGAILDVACGLGATTRWIAQRLPGGRVIGINISLRQLDTCRRSAPACDFALVDAAHMAFKEDSFDLVTCVEAAFHFQTRKAFLLEAQRVLRRGGRLIMSDILFVNTSWVGDWMVPCENTIDSPAEYRDALARTGFECVQIQDATEECWRAYCRECMRSAKQRLAARLIDCRAFERRMAYLQGLLHEAVRCYLLISARKPGA